MFRKTTSNTTLFITLLNLSERTVFKDEEKKKSLFYDFIDGIRRGSGQFLYLCAKLFQLPTVRWFVTERITVASKRGYLFMETKGRIVGQVSVVDGGGLIRIKITNVFRYIFYFFYVVFSLRPSAYNLRSWRQRYHTKSVEKKK